MISPLLLNAALHGLEEAAGVRITLPHSCRKNGVGLSGSGEICDLVACCHSQQQAQEVKARLAAWLAPRGLAFNDDKTSIVHLGQDGFDFLGFSVRRYQESKLLIKPSNKFRNDRWIFGARDRVDDQGAVPYLIRFSWTDIVRHQMVQGTASPDAQT